MPSSNFDDGITKQIWTDNFVWFIFLWLNIPWEIWRCWESLLTSGMQCELRPIWHTVCLCCVWNRLVFNEVVMVTDTDWLCCRIPSVIWKNMSMSWWHPTLYSASVQCYTLSSSNKPISTVLCVSRCEFVVLGYVFVWCCRSSVCGSVVDVCPKVSYISLLLFSIFDVAETCH